MMYDFLIVGAGFAGSVLAERISSQLDKKVLVVEKRNHIAGNCYDYYNDKGILVHKYGPHIFHTNSKKVWDYLSQFTEWVPYEHKVLAVVNGIKIPVPFNLNSLYKIFPQDKAKNLENKLLNKYKYGLKIPILKLRENTESDLKDLSDFIYEKIFYGYTVKQWSLKPDELEHTVTARVPVSISHDDRYFQDKYQGIPANGYTNTFEKMLNNGNIDILLNSDYREIINDVKFNKMIYTGAIDEYFDYMYGKLPYRSLTFKLETLEQKWFQETAQINYPNDFDYTRITEFKHFLKISSEEKNNFTTIAYEFPCEFESGKNEPYYPIPQKNNEELYQKYKFESDKFSKNVLFIGRLTNYKYFNMEEIIGIALMIFDKNIADYLS